MNEHLKYEKQADRLIKAFKVNMPYYRIVNATKGRVIFEQAFSHAMATNPVSLEAFKESIKRGASYTNMSAVKPYMAAEEYKQLTRINEMNMCRVPDYEESKLKQADGLTYYSLVVEGKHQKELQMRALSLTDFVEGKVHNIVLTNPEALKPYLIKQLALTDKKFVAEKILDGYASTFCTGYSLNYQKKGDKARITFSMNREHVEDTTTIFVETTKDNIHIKGKRNNNVLDRTYSWKTLQNYNSSNYIRIVYKMHYDTCNDLKMTPFAFLFHPKYIASAVKPMKMKDFRNMTQDNSFPTVQFTCVDPFEQEFKIKMRIDISSFKKFQDDACLDSTMDDDLFKTTVRMQHPTTCCDRPKFALESRPYFHVYMEILDEIIASKPKK